MPASLIPNAKQQFEDINGAPLVGGKVYMYTIGTLIFKDTWQDAGQTGLNENPVPLDSRGQAIIYGVGNYRQILTDSLDNVIWDRNIEGLQESVFGPAQTINSATVTDLGSVSSNNVTILGTTTINSFGTSALLSNPIYFIQFTDVLTLTYNATSMILPGSADITTAAGDGALVEIINSAGYWRMISYFSTAASGVLGTASTKNIGTSGGTVPLLNGANIWGGINRYQKQTYGDEVSLSVVSNTTTPDFATGNNFVVAISANWTLANPNNLQPGQSGIIRVMQNNAGLTMSWGSAYKASGGIASVNLSGINGAADYFAFYSHSSGEIVISPLPNVS